MPTGLAPKGNGKAIIFSAPSGAGLLQHCHLDLVSALPLDLLEVMRKKERLIII